MKGQYLEGDLWPVLLLIASELAAIRKIMVLREHPLPPLKKIDKGADELWVSLGLAAEEIIKK